MFLLLCACVFFGGIGGSILTVWTMDLDRRIEALEQARDLY